MEGMTTDKGGKEGSMAIVFIVMLISLGIAYYWDRLPLIRNSVESLLDPTFGALIGVNVLLGFLVAVAVITLILTLAQKYLTDQKELKKLKEENKMLQKQMREVRDHPEKLMSLQGESFKIALKMFQLSFRSLAYTSIPIILFFRWFQEILYPIYGGWWILYYLLASMIFSSIFRKVFKVA